MNPELIAALGGLTTATGAVITGIFATRSKVKLDDIARLHKRIGELEQDLVDERAARESDGAANRTKHTAMIADYEAQIAALGDRLRQRDQTINHLDRVVLALRTYVARARRTLVGAGVEPPESVEGMDE